MRLRAESKYALPSRVVGRFYCKEGQLSETCLFGNPSSYVLAALYSLSMWAATPQLGRFVVDGGCFSSCDAVKAASHGLPGLCREDRWAWLQALGQAKVSASAYLLGRFSGISCQLAGHFGVPACYSWYQLHGACAITADPVARWPGM